LDVAVSVARKLAPSSTCCRGHLDVAVSVVRKLSPSLTFGHSAIACAVVSAVRRKLRTGAGALTPCALRVEMLSHSRDRPCGAKVACSVVPPAARIWQHPCLLRHSPPPQASQCRFELRWLRLRGSRFARWAVATLRKRVDRWIAHCFWRGHDTAGFEIASSLG